MNDSVVHRVLSTRECAIAEPELHRIEAMQQLFLLKKLPAEQLRQDVPPGPGPFPQKEVAYNTNPMTENILQSTMNAVPNGAFVGMNPLDSYNTEADDASNNEYRVFIPNALQQSETFDRV